MKTDKYSNKQVIVEHAKKASRRRHTLSAKQRHRKIENVYELIDNISRTENFCNDN